MSFRLLNALAQLASAVQLGPDRAGPPSLVCSFVVRVACALPRGHPASERARQPALQSSASIDEPRGPKSVFRLPHGKERHQLGDTAQMKPSVSEHLEEYRVLSSRTGDRNAQIGFVLGEVQNLGRIDEHGRCLAGMEPPRIHLTDVCNQLGFDAPRPGQNLSESAE